MNEGSQTAVVDTDPADEYDQLNIDFQPCAPWCVENHSLSTHPEDHYCRSERQTLATKRREPVRRGGGSWRWPFLSVSVRREWNESVPHVVLVDDEDREIELGLDEAAGLYAALKAAIDEALR